MKKYSIAASLEYGRYFSKWWVVFFYVGLFLSSIGFAIFILLAIEEANTVFLLGLFLPGLMSLASLYLIINNHKLAIKIKLWLKDSVELNAKSTEIDAYKYSAGISKVDKRKIRIIFVFNGKKIIKISGKPGYNRVFYNTKAGYEGIFKKFANKSIKILYSEKYDQVLILND